MEWGCAVGLMRTYLLALAIVVIMGFGRGAEVFEFRPSWKTLDTSNASIHDADRVQLTIETDSFNVTLTLKRKLHFGTSDSYRHLVVHGENLELHHEESNDVYAMSFFESTRSQLNQAATITVWEDYVFGSFQDENGISFNIEPEAVDETGWHHLVRDDAGATPKMQALSTSDSEPQSRCTLLEQESGNQIDAVEPTEAESQDWFGWWPFGRGNDDDSQSEPQDASSCLFREPNRFIEVLVVNDYDQYSRWGSKSVGRAHAVLSVADSIFRISPFKGCLSLKIAGVITLKSRSASRSVRAR